MAKHHRFATELMIGFVDGAEWGPHGRQGLQFEEISGRRARESV